MIEHGKTGWLAALKDVDSLANSILAYNSMSETEKAVIKNNAALVAGQHYSSPVVARQYLKLYK
jgi:glycosyltransferase involved in cell wall biosynthesis